MTHRCLTQMPTTKYTNLAAHLRNWGLKVVEIPGWQTRSSNWSKTFSPRGVICHHTAGPTGGGDYPSRQVILDGQTWLRPPTPGPLAQLGLGRSGTVYLFGGHRANHAGIGGPYGNIPEDSGNAYMWGIEAENDGAQPWPTAQLQAYYRLCAALMAYSDFGISYVIGHKEWTSRKPDPHSLNMATFRTNVAKAYAAGPSGGELSFIQEVLNMTEAERAKFINDVAEAAADKVWGRTWESLAGAYIGRPLSAAQFLRFVHQRAVTTDDDLNVLKKADRELLDVTKDLAKLATSGMSDADRAALANEIAERVSKVRVDIKVTDVPPAA